MTDDVHSSSEFSETTTRAYIGVAMVLGGGLVLASQLLNLVWLAPFSILAGGTVMLYGGIKHKWIGLTAVGLVLCGTGTGAALAFNLVKDWSMAQRAGMILLFSAAGFALISPIYHWMTKRSAWWPALPLSVIAPTGLCLLFSMLRVVDFTLYITASLGLAFLWIGLTRKWIGMIIPGCILVSTGAGVFVAWGTTFTTHALAKTGTMLVLFAFGWGLITVFSRTIIDKFIWWPLIPGGLLAVVGWGLFIGGDPGSAANFIGNTGSIVIMILGLYLLMLRRGIRQ
jgi:hypothetical protein